MKHCLAHLSAPPLLADVENILTLKHLRIKIASLQNVTIFLSQLGYCGNPDTKQTACVQPDSTTKYHILTDDCHTEKKRIIPARSHVTGCITHTVLYK